MSKDDYEHNILTSWEEVFKKSQLTLWIMLALKDGPKHMADIKAFAEATTGGTIKADDKSVYRALRRYYDLEMVDFSQEPGRGGPDRKVYRLTTMGLRILNDFTKRNITKVFYQPAVMRLIEQ